MYKIKIFYIFFFIFFLEYKDYIIFKINYLLIIKYITIFLKYVF